MRHGDRVGIYARTFRISLRGSLPDRRFPRNNLLDYAGIACMMRSNLVYVESMIAKRDAPAVADINKPVMPTLLLAAASHWRWVSSLQR